MEPIDPTEPIQSTDPILPLQPQADLVITAEAKYFLHTAGRWATFLGILGFVFTGFIVLAAIFAGTMLAGLSKLQNAGNPYGGTGASIFAAMSGYISFIYLLVALFYFFFSFYMYKFGSEIKSGTTFNNTLQVTAALKNLKSFLSYGVLPL